MRVLKLTLQYDGTELVGWQRQKSGDSVQGLLEAALSRIDGVDVAVHGAGRTDAGVHAVAQVASAHVASDLDTRTLRRAINAHRRRQVRVTSVEDAAPDFHARFSATGKTYRYLILERDVASPFLWRYVWPVPGVLDVDRMQAAAAALVGSHDFSAFQSTGSTVSHAVRVVTAASVRVWTDGMPPPVPVALAGDAGRLVVFEVTASGFLRHMVRALAGTLVEIGLDRRPPGTMSALLGRRVRADAGPTAPAAGLWLVSVDYC